MHIEDGDLYTISLVIIHMEIWTYIYIPEVS